MKLSLIIPVYNVEQYIGRCLKSCLSQPHVTAEDYELVIVNDGTKDSSMAVVAELTCGRTNVTVINQHNQGLSMARNAGLKAAQGEYVWFVDSDDWIEEGCLSGIMERLEQTGVDALQLQYRNVYADAPDEEVYSTIHGIVEGREWLLSDAFFVAVPFMVYRREFLLRHNLTFYPGIYHEDNEFKPRMLYLARTCASYDKIAYNYLRGNAGSITSTLRLKNGRDNFVVMNSLYTFVREHDIRGRYRRAFYTQIGNTMKMVLRTVQAVSSDEAEILIGLMRDNRHLFRCMCHAHKLKIRLGGMLMYIHLPLGLRIFKLYV